MTICDCFTVCQFGMSKAFVEWLVEESRMTEFKLDKYSNILILNLEYQMNSRVRVIIIKDENLYWFVWYSMQSVICKWHIFQQMFKGTALFFSFSRPNTKRENYKNEYLLKMKKTMKKILAIWMLLVSTFPRC